MWDDWDEGCFGEQDTEENREEYPDGFIWSCCDKDGTHPGCTRGPHRAVGATRGRYSLQGLNKNGNSRDGRSSNEDEEGEEEEDEE